MDFHETLYRHEPKPDLIPDKLSEVKVKGQGHRGHIGSGCLKQFM